LHNVFARYTAHPGGKELFSIISAFDGAYGAYNAYQNGMERFWTLQYLKQHQITELSATVFKAFPGQPPMARADDLPLVLPVIGGGDLPRGARVQLRLGEIDDISLDIHGQLLQVLEADAPTSAEESAMLDDDSDDTVDLMVVQALVEAVQAYNPQKRIDHRFQKYLLTRELPDRDHHEGFFDRIHLGTVLLNATYLIPRRVLERVLNISAQAVAATERQRSWNPKR
jgi:hypothetical protein